MNDSLSALNEEPTDFAPSKLIEDTTLYIDNEDERMRKYEFSKFVA